jgi:hypothetical protein
MQAEAADAAKALQYKSKNKAIKKAEAIASAFLMKYSCALFMVEQKNFFRRRQQM